LVTAVTDLKVSRETALEVKSHKLDGKIDRIVDVLGSLAVKRIVEKRIERAQSVMKESKLLQNSNFFQDSTPTKDFSP
jgi:hypothetical protein